MEEMLLLVVLGVLGLGFGSFAGAQVWRLRARQLLADKKAGEPVDAHELKALRPLVKHIVDDRSQCLHCGHVLAWYDLFPLFSWLSTGGRCRYCQTRIGLFEPLMELGVASYFVLSFMFWPVPIVGVAETAQFFLWLIAGVQLVILFGYDAKWFLLPDRVVFPLIAVSVVYSVLTICQSPEPLLAAVNTLGAVAILSGVYLVLWLVSHGRWIGFGDVKLGIALGLLLGSWELAFLGLFLANLIGSLVVLPGLVSKQVSRTTQIPFGPFLIVGFFIAAIWGKAIITLYLSTGTVLML